MDEFVSAYQDAVMYMSQNCKSIVMNLQQVFKVTAATENWSPVTLAIASIITVKPHSSVTWSAWSLPAYN